MENKTVFALVFVMFLLVAGVLFYVRGDIRSIVSGISNSMYPKVQEPERTEGTDDTMVMVSHSEYWSGEEGQILTRLLNYQGTPISDANCTVDILNPDRTYFVSSEQMTFDTSSYYYKFTTPVVEGVYQYKATCLYNDNTKERSAMNSFHLSPALNFEKIAYDNLSNQITNLSNLEQVHFSDVSYNLSQIKQDTEYIRTNMQTQSNANSQYNDVVQKLNDISNFCGNNYTSNSLLCQWVNETRNRVIDINNTIIVIVNQSMEQIINQTNIIINQTQTIINQTQILINITQNIVSEVNQTVSDLIDDRLNGIITNISDMQNDLEYLKNSTNFSITILIEKIDSLQQNFSDLMSEVQLLRNETYINNQTISERFNSLDIQMNSVISQINTIENKLDCNNTVNTVCDKIDEIMTGVIQVNITSNFIREYLEGMITEYLINITNQTSGAGNFMFKGVPEIDLLIDNFDSDVTRSGGLVQFTVELVRPENSSGLIEFYVNNVLNVTGSSVLSVPLFMSQGVYIIKAKFLGDGNYSTTTEQHTLTITSTNNIPYANLIYPVSSSVIDLPYNITFNIIDDNSDSVSLLLYSNGVFNKTITSSLSGTDNYYYWSTSTTPGYYDLVLKVCEIGTVDLYCVNDTHSIELNNSCVPNWVGYVDTCLVNNTHYLYYEDHNNCGTSLNLPIDNGTYVYCDYCSPDISGPFYSPEECPSNSTQLQYYTDDNYDTCCVITGLFTDCLVDYIPYVNETVDCSYLGTDITLYTDSEPYISDRIDVFADLNMSNATKCWTYVKSENGLLQTNPRKTDYSDSMFFAKKTETREYFYPVMGKINAYYTKENLIAYKQFILGMSCALDNGTVVTGETYITPKYDDMRRVNARAVWGVNEASTLVFITVLAVFLIGYMIYAWKR